MQKSFILSFLILFATFISADFTVEKIFSINYNSEINVHQLPDTAQGVDSFCIDRERLFLLSSSENKVLCYSLQNQSLLETHSIPAFAVDITVDNNMLYIITTANEIHTVILNKRKSDVQFIEFSEGQQVTIVDNKPMIHLANGNTYNGKTSERGWKYSPSLNVFTEIINRHQGRVTTIKDGLENSLELSFDKELGTILPAGTTENYIYIRVEIVEAVDPIRVSEKLITIDTVTNTKIAETEVPQVHNNFFYNDYKSTNNALYKMMTTPTGIDILQIQSYPGIYNNKSFRDLYPKDYHYNNHLPARDESNEQRIASQNSPENTRISRAQIIRNAEKYLNVSWKASSKSVSKGIINVGGAKIRTPSWVTSKTHYKMPYKWGGFTSVSTFLSKVSQGKYAGDNYTKSVSWGDTYCVSVDCSGFVSRCWGTSKKYGTSTIQQISKQYKYISSLKRGDALNKSGSHIVLVNDRNPSGTVKVIESSGIDWAVSKRTRSLSSMTGYKPIYYKNVSGDEPVPGKGKLTGVIYDKAKGTSARISGAKVTLSSGKSATTSSSGVYSFELPAGSYTIYCNKDGYSASPITRQVKSGETIWGSIGMNK